MTLWSPSFSSSKTVCCEIRKKNVFSILILSMRWFIYWIHSVIFATYTPPRKLVVIDVSVNEDLRFRRSVEVGSRDGGRVIRVQNLSGDAITARVQMELQLLLQATIGHGNNRSAAEMNIRIGKTNHMAFFLAMQSVLVRSVHENYVFYIFLCCNQTGLLPLQFLDNFFSWKESNVLNKIDVNYSDLEF